MKRMIFIGLVIFSFSPGILRSQLSQEWVKTYNGSGNNNDEALSQSVDPSGNIYVAGKILQTSNLFDTYVVKYNSSGNLLWDKIYNGPGNGNDIANSVCTDSAGNVFVAGESKGVDSGSDYILLKYDSQGNEQWLRRFNGEANSVDAVIKVITDRLGNPVITGRSYSSGIQSDIVTIKYNTDGDVLWTRRYSGPSGGNDFAEDMVIDLSGNIYISGSSFVQGGVNDFLLIKYSSNGDEIWTKGYNGPVNGNDNSTSIALDNKGNIIITGTSPGSGTGLDFATLKYSSTGDQLWLRRYIGPSNSSPDEPKSITCDINGNIIITGTSVNLSSSYDFLTLMYSPSGDELWDRRYNGPNNNNFDEPRSVITDNNGSIFVAGLSQGTGTMDDMLIIRYDLSGNQIWINRYNSPENRNDIANNISVDLNGNLIVSGIIAGAVTLNDFAVVKFSQLTGLNNSASFGNKDYFLYQNYPNPFNPSTQIQFSIPKVSFVRLNIYDTHGRKIQSLIDNKLQPGSYNSTFNAQNLASGIYFYKLYTEEIILTRKMILLK